MTADLPPQRPEGKLIEDAVKADGRSVRSLAARAGMSDARWRQIVKGNQSMGNGHFNEVIAPALTLARMALVLGVIPEALESANRADAAGMLRRLLAEAQQGGAQSPPGASGATPAIKHADEIDLIYASQSMSAQEKLEAIRKVLHLRAQAEEDASLSDEASVKREGVRNGG